MLIQVVQSRDPDQVLAPVQRPPPLRPFRLERAHDSLIKLRPEHVPNPRQRHIPLRNLVRIRQAIHLTRGQVHEHVMRALQAMRVRVRRLPPPGKVLTTHQTPVRVHVGQRNRTALLEIKIQRVGVDGVQVRTHYWHRCRRGRRRRGRRFLRATTLATTTIITAITRGRGRGRGRGAFPFRRHSGRFSSRAHQNHHRWRPSPSGAHSCGRAFGCFGCSTPRPVVTARWDPLGNTRNFHHPIRSRPGENTFSPKRCICNSSLSSRANARSVIHNSL
mmetsp:Transcript_5024/g.16862  ORF Transcript_5024/g.16862 Transcript_5024/m.16862 type:complete len:275 (-) Transcript_5024:544-1368(-)